MSCVFLYFQLAARENLPRPVGFWSISFGLWCRAQSLVVKLAVCLACASCLLLASRFAWSSARRVLSPESSAPLSPFVARSPARRPLCLWPAGSLKLPLVLHVSASNQQPALRSISRLRAAFNFNAVTAVTLLVACLLVACLLLAACWLELACLVL